jgi:hypothetical protein
VKTWTLLLLVFLAIHFAALFSPSLLDDADATHAQAAQHMALTGDWVTLKVDGIRYLEKPPLPYWIIALDYHVFGFNVFATHLPLSLGVLGCAILAWVWSRRAFGERAAFYAALGFLTTVGVFLFTRYLIPESLLTFFTALALYCFLTGLEEQKPARFYVMYASLALALLAKGLIAPVFFLSAVIPYLLLTGQWRRWRELRIFSGLLLFLAIAAPWHILAGLRNPDQGNPVGNVPSPGNVHGFFYFYFINEHVLRFLGKRYPHDYNKLPAILYWTLHLAWLFPWSLYIPLAIRRAWQRRATWISDLRPFTAKTVDFYIDRAESPDVAKLIVQPKFRARTQWLLGLYAAFILVFFSISTNQEYYTFPAYFPLIILITAALAEAEDETSVFPNPWLIYAHAIFCTLGVAAAITLGLGLWSSRKLPFVADIGSVLAHRGVGGYSLSMSHFFDLTGPSIAALRLPAVVAAMAFLVGPLVALTLRRKRHHFESTVSVAFTVAVVLIAAHTALVRFGPMLSSHEFAERINAITTSPDDHDAQLMLYGDQADGSSVIFYTHRPALLVYPPSTTKVFGSSLIWGSDYPDAPRIVLTDGDLLATWGKGARKLLFVSEEERDHVAELFGERGYLLMQLGGKALYTDRALKQ